MTIFNLGGGGGGSSAYYIRVRVSGSAGTPDLSGIQVTATSSGRPTVTGTTDSTGECYLSVRQGATYTVALSKQYYTFSPASQQATTSEPVTDLTATCYVQPSITVNVGGVDISGRTVTLTPSSGSAVSQVTGSSGSVTFRGLDITTYTITCDYPAGQGVSPASDTQTTAAGGSYTKTFTVLSKPSLTVTVGSATGNIANRTITATPSSGSTVTAQTNGSGVATLTLMAGVAYTVSCDSPSGYFSVSSQQTNLAAGADSDMSFTLQRKPQVTVTVTDASGGGNQSGRTVQMSNGSDTQTQTTSSGGTCSFVANGTGSYTFTITNIPEGASVATVTQSLAADGVYNVSMEITFGWTHGLNFNASTFKTDDIGCLTYADDLVGKTPISNTATSLAKVTQEGSWGFDPDTGMDMEGLFFATFQNGSDGQFFHQLLNPYNKKQYIALWDDDAKEWDYAETGNSAVASENTMLVVPRYYRKGTATKLVHSSKASEGTAYAHTLDNHVYQYKAIANYLCINQNGVLKSLSGVTATRNQTRATFRTQARANVVRNGKAIQWNYHDFRMMFEKNLMREKRFNAQKIAQGGLSYNSPTTGLCDALGPYAGNTSGQSNAESSPIENLYGCCYQFLDDVYCSGTTMYVGQNSSPSDDTNNKTAISLPYNATGFPGEIETSDIAWGMGHATGGSATAGLCDYQDLAFGSSYPLVFVGGSSDNVSNGNAGPGYVICNNLSNSNANIGARLSNPTISHNITNLTLHRGLTSW